MIYIHSKYERRYSNGKKSQKSKGMYNSSTNSKIKISSPFINSGNHIIKNKRIKLSK